MKKQARTQTTKEGAEIPIPKPKNVLARVAIANGKRLTANGRGESEGGAGLERMPPSRRLQRNDELRAQFERFWAEYPKKVGKDAAWREWLRKRLAVIDGDSTAKLKTNEFAEYCESIRELVAAELGEDILDQK